jgi:hypothetical protein
MSDLSNDNKKHTMKSRETIPLNKFFLSNFSIFASRRSEFILWLDLAFSPSPGLQGKIFFYCLYKGN